jgi:pyridoxal phosphate enzyme (YggS family)
LREQLLEVEQKIMEACRRAGRVREEVTVVAVSKTKPVSMLQTAYQLGVREFGENKVQELCDKYEAFGSEVHWHMIGHLQRNKVKQVVDKAALIHSLDSEGLAAQIEKESAKIGRRTPVLVEVNMAQEESKFGISPENAEDFIRKIAEYPHILVQGLMTVAPYVENPEENRVYFRNLRQVLIDINGKSIDNVDMKDLSMGMTNDYEIAIEEGATIIRIGTGIFGNRIYLN